MAKKGAKGVVDKGATAVGIHDDESFDGMVDFVIKCEHLNIEDYSGKKAAKLQEIRKQRQNTFKAIKACGLTIARRQSSTKDKEGRPKCFYILVTATDDKLMSKAEQLKISKLVKDEFKDWENKSQGYDDFTSKKLDRFVPGKDGFFTSLERQRVIYRKLEAKLTDEGAGLDLDSLKKDGVITDFFFMHDEEDVKRLKTIWVYDKFRPAPVHEVRAYLGDKIGFYFAFLEHYLNSLMPLSIFSLAVFAYQLYQNQVDNILIPFYNCVICIWSTVMLELWKRRQAELAYQWDVENFVEEEPSRPEYLAHKLTVPMPGVFSQSVGFVPLSKTADQNAAKRLGSGATTDNKELSIAEKKEADEEGATPVFPQSVHFQRVVLSLLITCFLILCVAVGALFILAYKVVLRRNDDLGETNGNYIGSLMNVLFITFTDQIWSRLALWLNDFEMYRTDSQWYNALIYKTFSFRFINKNVTPLYIAFVQSQKLALFGFNERDECPNEDCLSALSEYLLVAVVFSEVTRNLTTLIPLVLDWVKRRLAERQKAKTEGEAQTGADESQEEPDVLEIVEREAINTEYPGTFDEVCERWRRPAHASAHGRPTARSADARDGYSVWLRDHVRRGFSRLPGLCALQQHDRAQDRCSQDPSHAAPSLHGRHRHRLLALRARVSHHYQRRHQHAHHVFLV